MLKLNQPRSRHRNVRRKNPAARVRATGPIAHPYPKAMDERFSAALLSGEKSQMDRILREIAEVFPASEASAGFLELMSRLLARSAHQALKLHLAQEKLKHLALRDELTGLHNRRGFFELAAQQMKSARRKSEHALLFFADINGLKQINDRFGHAEGDASIKRIAQVLERTFRASDIVARLGGDEFAVFANEASEQAEILGRLRENLESEAARDSRYPLSLSVGVAVFDPRRPATLDELLNLADRAMYENKKARAAA